MRVFATSDIHVDYDANKQWLFDLSNVDYQDDILLVAGDLTDDLALLEQCLVQLTKKFRQVFFVPGNHELWVRKDTLPCSFAKFDRVLALCGQCGVATQPINYGELSIVPLFSWYDFSFGEPGPKILASWVDFRACQWGDTHTPASVTAFFLQKNREHLQRRNHTVISFSHFLPSIDLMPDFVGKAFRYIYPVLGSELLGEQLQQLKPNIHIYGHSHLNRQVTKGNTVYINNAYGYPSEERIARKTLLCIYEQA